MSRQVVLGQAKGRAGRRRESEREREREKKKSVLRYSDADAVLSRPSNSIIMFFPSDQDE